MTWNLCQLVFPFTNNILLYISGLLKDYLRELPEPLFNKALFDMMDDGLSVCLPDDPTGNAKLMFSILECLDKASRVRSLLQTF